MDFLPPEKETRVDDGIEGKQKVNDPCVYSREKRRRRRRKKKKTFCFLFVVIRSHHWRCHISDAGPVPPELNSLAPGDRISGAAQPP
jgi:hypothetical protein